MKPSKDNTFCAFPFNQVCIKSEGKFSPCCNSERPENNWNPLNIGEHEINGMTPIDMFEHDSMKELREYGLNNKRHPACTTCWKQEDNGIKSPRLFSSTTIIDTNNFKLKCIDTATSNKCNLRCMMCYPGTSTGLQKDVKYFKEHGITLPISWGKHDVEEPGPINVWKWLNENNHLLEELKVSGGEPFYDKDFNRFLDKAHSNLVLHIHTNGTKIKMDKIKKFKKLVLIFSIDGIGKTYEYIRYPMTWKVIERKTKQYVKERPQDKIHTNFVLSSLNALNVADYLKWCFGLGLSPTCSDMHPFEDSDISILNLSEEILEESLMRFDIREYKKQCEGLYIFPAVIDFYSKLEYALDNCKDNPKAVLNHIEKFDKSRNRSYKDFMEPMMIEWLNP